MLLHSYLWIVLLHEKKRPKVKNYSQTTCLFLFHRRFFVQYGQEELDALFKVSGLCSGLLRRQSMNSMLNFILLAGFKRMETTHP